MLLSASIISELGALSTVVSTWALAFWSSILSFLASTFSELVSFLVSWTFSFWSVIFISGFLLSLSPAGFKAFSGNMDLIASLIVK